MSVLFIITLLLLAAVAYRIYRKQQELNSYRAERELYRAQPRSLFDQPPERAESERLAAARALTESARDPEEFRLTLLARAASGDLAALADAHRAGDPEQYRLVLAEALDWAGESEEKTRALASFVASDKDGLRGSTELTRAYRKIWEREPDRAATARMLHLAALSDDAETFSAAVGAAAGALREGRLKGLSGEELRSLAESEFWVLSSDARTTGAGFVLKQRLASLRQELPP